MDLKPCSLGHPPVPTHQAWAAATDDEQLRMERQWLELIAGRAIQHAECELLAFEQLYRAYVLRLHDQAKAHLSSADATDIVQSVFFGIWMRRLKLPPETVLRAYLRGAIHHRLQNARASAAVHLRLVTADHGDAVPGFAESRAVNPSEALEYEEALRAALDVMPQRTRLTVILFYAFNFTRRQVAALAGISVRTVKHDLTAARPILQSPRDSRPDAPRIASIAR